MAWVSHRRLVRVCCSFFMRVGTELKKSVMLRNEELSVLLNNRMMVKPFSNSMMFLLGDALMITPATPRVSISA